MAEDENASDKDDGMKQSLFLNSLELWIDEKISQDGLTEKELIRTIKKNFERDMQANIEHHKYMMNNAKENNDQRKAERHKIMVAIYQALLGGK